MDMTLNEFKLLTSNYWNGKNQPLIFDLTKNKNSGRYRLGLNGLFVPDTNRFNVQ